MRWHTAVWLLSRRSFMRRLGIAFAIFGVTQPDRSAWAQETGASTTGLTREHLIPEHDGMTDAFGRIPLCRLTFEPGASLPDSFLAGPFVASVETAGLFDVSTWEDTRLQIAAGDQIEVPEDAAVAVTNVSDEVGAWLVLGLADPSRRMSEWFTSEEFSYGGAQDPAPGVTWRWVFLTQDLYNRYRPTRFTVDRITLAPKATVTDKDLEGATPTRAIGIAVGAGAIMVQPSSTATPNPPSDTTLSAGEAGIFSVDEARDLRAAGGSPAPFLLGREADV
jgi:hypothetical protein